MDFKAITTQEEFNKAIQDRLKRERETIEKEYADYEELKNKNQELEKEIGILNSSLSTANEKTGIYDKDISDLKAKIAGYETANLKTKIALEYGIPYNLASRLIGEDEEGIKKDAEQLAELVKQKQPIAPLKDVEPQISGENGAYKSLLENLNLEGE